MKPKKKSDLFNQTLYTHPAIFMVEYALAQVLMDSGIKPDYVLGTSIGEFASAALSDVMTFEESLLELIKQAEVLEDQCEEGGMLAILHDPNLYHENQFIYGNSELVSVNFHSHFVVSGQKNSLKDIEQYLKANQICCQALPVTQGFHSPLIDPAAGIYTDFLNERSYNTPRLPFISCRYANVLTKINNGYFWEVIRKPIEFQKALMELEKSGNHIYLDLGPSGTLANFVKYNLPENSESKSFSILSPFGQDLNNLRKIQSLVQ
jgi:trans-AT polyketide synthase/acyltransferase/oxidoreductase domain-containing protein